jgi:carotenoid 1,2-hydratase
MRGANPGSVAPLRPEAQLRSAQESDHRASAIRDAVPGDGGSALRPEHPWLGGVLPSAGCANEAAWPVSGRRQHPPGSGAADGGAFRPAGGVGPDGGPCFDRAIPLNGYVWWYVDALSEDGQHGLTIIAFLGSVFSPYYAFRRRRGGMADPLAHAALNVALYGDPVRWAMTERGSASVRRDASSLTIGPSSLRWDGEVLVVEIHEINVPLPRPIRGQVRIMPTALTDFSTALDGDGRHRWRLLAPDARVEVTLDQPSLRWSGAGYLDTNDGDEPLETCFRRWDWSRAALARGESVILYDTFTCAGDERSTSILIGRDGAITPIAPPPRVTLSHTSWRLPRFTRAEEAAARVTRTLTDAPFYVRSVLQTQLLGYRAQAIHESVDLGRFAAPWTQLMLPFRMPRALA